MSTDQDFARAAVAHYLDPDGAVLATLACTLPDEDAQEAAKRTIDGGRACRDGVVVAMRFETIDGLEVATAPCEPFVVRAGVVV